jgi:hypothetical protein
MPKINPPNSNGICKHIMQTTIPTKAYPEWVSLFYLLFSFLSYLVQGNSEANNMVLCHNHFCILVNDAKGNFDTYAM